MKSIGRKTGEGWVVFWLLVLAMVAGPGCSGGGGGDGADDAGVDVSPVRDSGEEADSRGDSEGDGGGDASCPSDEADEWYPDGDGDGFGDESVEPTVACEQPGPQMVTEGGDCDDSNADVHPDAEEICNGRDDDCDGTADADETEIAPESCPKSDGVCEGATVERCTEDGSDYASCGAEEYGEAYRDAPDEAWRCDGRDNDCDGEADEACCAEDDYPSWLGVDTTFEARLRPEILAAGPDAPTDGDFLVAWHDESNVKLQHVSKSGLERGPEESVDVGARVESIDAIRDGGDYVVAVTREREVGEPPIVVYRFGSDFSSDTPEVYVESEGETARNVEILEKDASLWVVYDFETSDELHEIRAAVIDVSSGEVVTLPFQADSGPGAERALRPQMADVGGAPVVVWWNKSAAEIRGVRLADGFPENNFYMDLGDRSRLQSSYREPLGLVPNDDGELGVIYPKYGDRGRSNLAYVELPVESSEEIEPEETELTGRESGNRQPAVAGADLDGDGTADRSLVVWARGPKDEPALVAGTFDPEAPEKLSPRTVVEAGDAAFAPEMAVAQGRVGLVWYAVGNSEVRYAPTSVDGVGVCDPNP